MRTVAIFVAALIAVTLAFGMTAPVESVTIPVIVPSPAVCAAARWAAHPRQNASPSKRVAAKAKLPLRAYHVLNVVIRPLG